MQEEIFGPVMTIYLYDENKYAETLELCNQTSPYALTGSIFSTDKYAMIQACKAFDLLPATFISTTNLQEPWWVFSHSWCTCFGNER